MSNNPRRDKLTKEESKAALEAQAPVTREAVLVESETVAQPSAMVRQSPAPVEIAASDTNAVTMIADDDYKLALAIHEANQLAFSMVDYFPVKKLHEDNTTFFIVDAAQTEIQDPDDKASLLDRIVLKLRDAGDASKIYYTMFAPNHVRDKFPMIFTKFRMAAREVELGPFEVTQGKNKNKGNYPWLFRPVNPDGNFINIIERKQG